MTYYKALLCIFISILVHEAIATSCKYYSYSTYGSYAKYKYCGYGYSCCGTYTYRYCCSYSYTYTYISDVTSTITGGVIAAIVIGCLVAVGIVVAIIVCICCAVSKRRATPGMVYTPQAPTAMVVNSTTQQQAQPYSYPPPTYPAYGQPGTGVEQHAYVGPAEVQNPPPTTQYPQQKY